MNPKETLQKQVPGGRSRRAAGNSISHHFQYKYIYLYLYLCIYIIYILG